MRNLRCVPQRPSPLAGTLIGSASGRCSEQDSSSSRLLAFHYQNVIPGQIIFSGNRFYSPASSVFYYLGGHPLTQWKSAVGDSSSTLQGVNFTDPMVTVADYFEALNGRPAGSATSANFIEQAGSSAAEAEMSDTPPTSPTSGSGRSSLR